MDYIVYDSHCEECRRCDGWGVFFLLQPYNSAAMTKPSYLVWARQEKKNTSIGSEGYSTKKEGFECYIRWPSLHNHPPLTQER